MVSYIEPDQPDSTIQAISIAEDQSGEQDNDNDIEPYEIVVSYIEPDQPESSIQAFSIAED